MKKKTRLGTQIQGLYRNPNNPFEAWDEEGRPCVPMTIDDDSPSKGTQPGPFGIFSPDGSRAVPASALMVSHFDWTAPDHPQSRIPIGKEMVSVDAKIAPMIFLMNQAGINTATSCQGDDRQRAYVMIADLPSALRFLRFWYWHLVPRGYSLPALDLEIRGADWREEIGADFPFPTRVARDSLGFSYTSVWKLYHEDLEGLMSDFLDALGREIEGQAAGRA